MSQTRIILVVIGLLFGACGSSTAGADLAAPPDAAGSADLSAAQDASVAGDLSKLSCAGILGCAAACGSTGAGCTAGCVTNASTTAQSKFGALSLCTVQMCGTGDGAAAPCLMPTSAGCTTCIQTKCTAQLADCAAN
jgi:hypothetical protein